MPSAFSGRVRPRAVVAATVVSGAVIAALAGAAPPASADPTPSSSSPTAVIVVLRDQLAAQPAGHGNARANAASAAQDTVLHRLAGPAPTKVIHYATGNAFAATVTADQAAALANDPAVASVVPDATVQIAPPTASQAASASPGATPDASPNATTTAAPVDPRACSNDPKHPQLEPEALQTINARSDDPSAKTAAALGVDGSGVKVAFIADGINPANAGFTRTNGSSAVVDYKDFYGDGPNAVTSGAEAFGDASAIAAQGNVTYDVADYSNPNVVSYTGGHCYIRVVGVAPGAQVVALKAGSELLPNSAILQAIDYAVNTAHVDVINESFGANLVPDSGARNTIQIFNDQAVAAGISVTTSTGDAGISSTIGSPATDPLVISTGASTDSRLYEQTGYALATPFGNGTWADDNVSALSSAGVTQSGRTIDVSAPGEADWAVCDDSGRFVGCTTYRGTYAKIQAFGGTSQAAPITAGLAALVIQAYRKTHAGSSPTPAVVKQIIVSTSRDLGLPGDEQGSGRIDARAAVEAAFTWPGSKAAAPAGTGQNVALSVGQLHLEGAPGSTQSGTVTVTNVGTQAQTLAPSSRNYLPIATAAQDTSLSTGSTTTTPYPTTGAPWVYKKLTFTVPGGTDELRSTILWQSGAAINGAGPVVRLSIFDPSGRYVGNTRPQGGANPANYGLITTKRPASGTWTAILYTPKSGGYSGTVTLDTRSLRAEPAGTVKVAASSLAPGASTTLTYTETLPGDGGDRVTTVSLGSSGGHQVAVPVVERAIIPSTGRGTFSGTITGGNGRSYSPAQSFGYAFDMPRGASDVRMSLTLSKDPSTLLEGVLIDPNGEVQSVNSNETLTASGTLSRGLSMVNTVASPLPGRWSYVVVVQPPVSGKNLTQPFTGALTFNQVKVSATPVPTSIAKGSSTTVTVQVTNTSAAPMVVQTDARRNTPTTLTLAPQQAGSTIDLPLDVENLTEVPYFLVPPDTTAMSLTASSTVPAQVELSSPPFGIDVFGDLRTAQGGNTISTASVSEKLGTVGPGVWTTYVQEIGPFTSAAPSGTSVLTATAVTKPFDTQVTSSTGDPYLVTVQPGDDGGSPAVIAPGTTATIRVTITPTDAKGSSVDGVLHLVSTPVSPEGAFNGTGEVLATIPYSYKVS